MRETIKISRNGASIRLPPAIMEAAHLHLGDPVNIRVEGNKIILEAIRAPKLQLAHLLDRITPENLHPEADFGSTMGEEAI